MKIRTQKGFTILESLLSLIALALVVFVGFYVYNSTHKANSTLDKTTKAASPSQQAPAKYLEIKELGIKLPLDNNLRNLTYSVSAHSQQDAPSVAFSDPSFTDAVKACKQNLPANAPALADLTRYKGTFDPNAMPQDVFQEFSKQLDGFYIEYGAGDGGDRLYCDEGASESSIKNVEQIGQKLRASFVKAAKEAQQL